MQWQGSHTNIHSCRHLNNLADTSCQVVRWPSRLVKVKQTMLQNWLHLLQVCIPVQGGECSKGDLGFISEFNELDNKHSDAN